MGSLHKCSEHDEHKVMYNCFLCRSSFQFGPHRYDGKPVNAWGIVVCLRCKSANWDGIVPTTYPHLIAHLNEKRIEPEINVKGWICWPTA
jgi:hypothetical protein